MVVNRTSELVQFVELLDVENYKTLEGHNGQDAFYNGLSYGSTSHIYHI